MSAPVNVPEGATCPYHAPTEPTLARWCCHRCGTFFCDPCACRTRPEAVPMCKGCWELRTRSVQPVAHGPQTRLQTVALVLGCLALLPAPAFWIAGIVVGTIATVKAKEGPAREARWKAIVGLCIALVSTLIYITLFSIGMFS